MVAGQPPRRHRRTRSRASPRRRASRWCGSTSATASARRCTRSPRCPTTGRAGQGPEAEARASCFAIEPMVNVGARRRPGCSTTAGRVVTADGSLLRPLRAHHRRHRRRPRDPHPARDRAPSGIDAVAASPCRVRRRRWGPSRPIAWLARPCARSRLRRPARRSRSAVRAGGPAGQAQGRRDRPRRDGDRAVARTPCSGSSSRTATRCSPTSPGRCACTTSASCPATGSRSSSRPYDLTRGRITYRYK